MDDPDHEYFTPGLKRCVDNAPQMVGCEAAYYFPTDVDVCAPILGVAGGQQPKRRGKTAEIKEEGSQHRMHGAGNLVVHVRSGDIFREGVNPNHAQVIDFVHSSVDVIWIYFGCRTF